MISLEQLKKREDLWEDAFTKQFCGIGKKKIGRMSEAGHTVERGWTRDAVVVTGMGVQPQGTEEHVVA